MNDHQPTLFDLDGDHFVATEHSRGPWDPRACHGGPVAALLVRGAERVGRDAREGAGGDRWQLSRITIELLRPVPVLVPLSVVTEIERPGRKVSLIGSTVLLADGTEVARSRALRIRVAPVALGDGFVPEPPFSDPMNCRRERANWAAAHTAFHLDSVEQRFAEGSWAEQGPVSMWMRLTVPVVAGEVPSGAQRAAATADFGNGVSSELDSDRLLYINPDLTVHLLRPPEGEWIGMRARSHYGPLGAGLAEAALYDSIGRVGRSVQSLFIEPRGTDVTG